MKSEESLSGIACRKKFGILDRLIFGLFGLILSILSLTTLWNSEILDRAIQLSLPSSWFIFISGLLLYWVSSPDLIILGDGIEIRILRSIKFVKWTQIIKVTQYKYYAVFELERLTPLNRLVDILIARTFQPTFSISASYTNYKAALRQIENNIGNRFVPYFNEKP